MKGRVEMLGEEESGLIPQVLGVTVRARPLRKKVLLVTACCLLCLCILGVPTAYLLIRNFKATRESASSIQIQNRSMPDNRQETATLYQTNEEKPRAHLTVRAVQWEKTVVLWENKMSLAFTENGMDYSEPYLQIPKAGDYFIYTQIALKPEPHCSKDSRFKGFELSIQKISRNYPEPQVLLSSTEYAAERCMRLRPIYLGAVVKLKERDRLLVNTTDIKMVDCRAEQKTFFGAFLL